MKSTSQRFGEKYLIVQSIYDEVNKIFTKFENKELEEDQSQIIQDTLKDIKYAKSILNKLNTRDLIDKPTDKIEQVKKNIDFFQEAFDHFQETFMSTKLYDEVVDSVRQYISRMKLMPSEYKRFAEDEAQLVIKFTNMLIRHYNTFKNQLKRMAVGTMSQKEFNKIYRTNHHKMIPTAGFQSYSNYEKP